MGYGNKRLLVIVAHPDDEAIGCGGTILRLKAEGWQLGLVYMSDGIGSRNPSSSQEEERKQGLHRALEILSPDYLKVFDFPDNQFDSVSQLQINKALESCLLDFKPSRLLTHWSGDLNIDHRIVANSALVAARPQPESSVLEFWMFETRSATDYAFSRHPFNPCLYVDITDYTEDKLKLLECYADEMRGSPHSRSISAINAHQVYRGNTVSVDNAEAFEIRYQII